MGNSIPTQVPCEALLIRCCDCVSTEAVFVNKLRRNLENLESAVTQLQENKSYVVNQLILLEGPITRRRETVEHWLSRVDSKVTEVNVLISRGQQETQRLCCADYCSKNLISSYIFGKSVANCSSDVFDLNQKTPTEFVRIVPAEPEYLQRVESNFEELRNTTRSLEELMNTVKQNVDNERRPYMKTPNSVQDWLLGVRAAMAEVQDLITNGQEEIKKLRLGSASNLSFENAVVNQLGCMVGLKNRGDEIEAVAEVDTDYIHKLNHDFKALKKTTSDLRGLHKEVLLKVMDAERKQKTRLPTVGQWLVRVEDTMAEVDQLSIDGPPEIQKMSLGDYASYGLAEKVTNSMKEVAPLIKRGSEFTEVAQGGLPETGIFIDSKETVGLDNTFKRVWSYLEEGQKGVVGLHGMGGVGKTTLLININNSLIKTPSGFDFVIWVVVAQKFTHLQIQEEIGRRIGIVVDEQWKDKGIRQRSEEVFKVLHNKKFVLLLDDLWDKINLETIGVPSPSPKNGSKVIFTTRSEAVCSEMGAVDGRRIKVETLRDKDAWELFCENVGETTFKDEPAIVPVAKQVAKECDGLPLALITVARAMACKKTLQEWKDALDDLKDSSLPGMEKEVHRQLKFSYDSLPNTKTKSCFLYCALFPEDHKILKEELIDFWIYEKIWEDDNSHRARKEGREIVRDLISVSLLEEEGVKYVKLHDVLRDMALWIARKFETKTANCFVKAGAQLIKAPNAREWKGIRRMSLMDGSIDELGGINRGNEEMVPNCPDLWTLIVRGNPRLRKISEGFFRDMNALVVLDLSNTSIQKLPEGISRLVSLQYLNVSHTEIDRLPPELELTNLKYLNLEYNRFLEMFPRILISKFKCLQVLKMIHCGFSYKVSEDNLLSDSNVLVEELQLLKDLKMLSITMRCASSLKMLSHNLSNCVQNLSLESFSSSKIIDASLIPNMENLETLQISATGDLEELKIESELGSIYNRSYFASLREVNVEYCSCLQNLNCFGLAPILVVLKVSVCQRMEAIISGGNLDGENLFKRLEELVLEELPQLKSISQNALPFPRLKRMQVLNCPMLTKLPLNSSTAGGSKIIVEAEEHWWKKVEWMDDAPKTDFRICPPRKKKD